MPASRLKWTLLRRSGTVYDDATFRTQYMDGGRSWMTHRNDPDGYEEMIHFTQIDENRCHILRTGRAAGGGWAVYLNSVIEDKSDGSQREERFDSPWSAVEAMNYSRLGDS